MTLVFFHIISHNCNLIFCNLDIISCKCDLLSRNCDFISHYSVSHVPLYLPNVFKLVTVSFFSTLRWPSINNTILVIVTLLNTTTPNSLTAVHLKCHWYADAMECCVSTVIENNRYKTLSQILPFWESESSFYKPSGNEWYIKTLMIYTVNYSRNKNHVGFQCFITMHIWLLHVDFKHMPEHIKCGQYGFINRGKSSPW